MVKSPLPSVEVERLVPFTTTVTPGSGLLSSVEVTFPLISLCWATTEKVRKDIVNTKMKQRNFLIIWVLIYSEFVQRRILQEMDFIGYVYITCIPARLYGAKI